MLSLELTQKQIQTLSPQQLLSIQVLQMSALEVDAFLREVAIDNPVVELEEPAAPPDGREELLRRLRWLEDNDRQNRVYLHRDAEELDPLSLVGTDGGLQEDLYAHLCAQLSGDGPTQRAARLLAGCLDRDGLLRDVLDELVCEPALSRTTLEDGLRLLWSLDPPGVGARDLRECLALQLRARGGDPLALTIVEEHLEKLARHQYHAIAQATGACQEAVRAAAARIQTLEPRPGAPFARQEDPIYLVPDLVVEEVEGTYLLQANDRVLPTLHISRQYQQLLAQTDDREVQDYLLAMIDRAGHAAQAVEKRRSTLLRCAGLVVTRQQAFFRRGPAALSPMTMTEAAQLLEVHPSTVSRAIREKYLQCPRGVYPLSFFFSRQLGPEEEGGGTSAQAAKARLRAQIDGEDKARPLSDEKLRQLLEGEGIVLSRRTVAKYREEMGLPGAPGRRTT